MKTALRAGLLCALLLICAALAAAWFVQREMSTAMHTVLPLERPTVFRIEPGHTAVTVAKRLEAHGWLRHYRLFALRARLDGVAGAIKAGTYELLPGDTLAVFLRRIVDGRTRTLEIAFIEGQRFADMRRALARNDAIIDTLSGLDDRAVLAALEIDHAHPEGLFFPATYRYHDDTPDREILLRAYRRMREVLDELWAERAAELPYPSPYEALIMASIVEKETAVAAEREAIAGVFVRRLRLGMKLQTDPTVIYGLGEAFDGDLRRADLQGDTPYNTYVHSGLPPTPIALPGRAAIEAALHPQTGEALYFVARGDGTHQFSRTLDEHNRAVRRYQLKR